MTAATTVLDPFHVELGQTPNPFHVELSVIHVERTVIHGPMYGLSDAEPLGRRDPR